MNSDHISINHKPVKWWARRDLNPRPPACEVGANTLRQSLTSPNGGEQTTNRSIEQALSINISINNEAPVESAFVYFIKVTGRNIVKIGYTTTHPETRLSKLQTSCPYPLELIAAIANCRRSDERAHHDFFAEERVNGEWFTYTPFMQTFLRMVCEEDCRRKGVSIETTRHHIIWEEFDDNAPSLSKGGAA